MTDKLRELIYGRLATCNHGDSWARRIGELTGTGLSFTPAGGGGWTKFVRGALDAAQTVGELIEVSKSALRLANGSGDLDDLVTLGITGAGLGAGGLPPGKGKGIDPNVPSGLGEDITPLGGRGSTPIDPKSPMSNFDSHLGESSRRPFDPDEIGLPISPRQLSTDKVRITKKGVDRVEQHLSRFGPDPQNQAQLQRLRDIANDRIQPTQADLNNYTHELRELLRYDRLGFRDGVPTSPDEAYRLWNNAHTATLEDYGLKEGIGVLYHPSTYQQ